MRCDAKPTKSRVTAATKLHKQQMIGNMAQHVLSSLKSLNDLTSSHLKRIIRDDPRIRLPRIGFCVQIHVQVTAQIIKAFSGVVLITIIRQTHVASQATISYSNFNYSQYITT